MNTFNVEVTLPESMDVTSREQTITVDLRAMDKDILSKAIIHGLTQKIADAAAGAANSAALGELGNMDGLSVEQKKRKVKEWTSEQGNWAIIAKEGKRMMEATLARLVDGDWGKERTGGGGVDPVTALARRMAAGIIKAGLVARDGNAKAYTALATADKHAACDKVIAAKPELLEQAEAELKAKREAVKAVALDDLGL